MVSHSNNISANSNLILFYNEIQDYIHETPTQDGEDEYFANSEAPRRMLRVKALLLAPTLRAGSPLERADEVKAGFITLETAVGRGAECVIFFVWQGTMTSNSPLLRG